MQGAWINSSDIFTGVYRRFLDEVAVLNLNTSGSTDWKLPVCMVPNPAVKH